MDHVKITRFHDSQIVSIEFGRAWTDRPVYRDNSTFQIAWQGTDWHWRWRWRWQGIAGVLRLDLRADVIAGVLNIQKLSTKVPATSPWLDHALPVRPYSLIDRSSFIHQYCNQHPKRSNSQP
jgi:hypothetical protein